MEHDRAPAEFYELESCAERCMAKKSDPEFLTLTQMDRGVLFGHRNDERAYFEWLGRIPCVERYYGDGRRGLVVELKRAPWKDELRELLALCHRYGVDMRQLAKFETSKNRAWFRAPHKYWHSAVFGASSDATQPGGDTG
jgi:hypothetical protein